MTAPPRLSRRAVDRLAVFAELLQRAYGAPERDLGNKSDPLDEAVYITLTLQTDIARATLMWARLKTAFPTWEALDAAHVGRLAQILKEGGLHRQKARTIKRLLREVKQLTGEFSLERLRHMSDADAEGFLLRLPGFSWKTARCVLLYSLNRDVFPIDSNAFRVLKRAGIIAAAAVYRRRALHDALQEAVPAPNRRPLHVNLVVHGQRTCLPRVPRCVECIARPVCAMRGVAVSIPLKLGIHSSFARAF